MVIKSEHIEKLIRWICCCTGCRAIMELCISPSFLALMPMNCSYCRNEFLVTNKTFTSFISYRSKIFCTCKLQRKIKKKVNCMAPIVVDGFTKEICLNLFSCHKCNRVKFAKKWNGITYMYPFQFDTILCMYEYD